MAHLEKKVEDLEVQARRASSSNVPSREDELAAADTTSRFDRAISTAPSILGLTEFTGHRRTEDIFKDSLLETINCAPDLATSDDNAPPCYRGKSTGIEILRHLIYFGESFLHFAIEPGGSAAKLASALDHSFSLHYLFLDSMTNVFLPSFTKLKRWTNIAFAEAFTLWPFIDREGFHANVMRLFEQPNFGRDEIDRDNLGLIYAVLALGQRYDPEPVEMSDDPSELGQFGGYVTHLRYYASPRHWSLTRL